MRFGVPALAGSSPQSSAMLRRVKLLRLSADPFRLNS
jgi:hypothetical protein